MSKCESNQSNNQIEEESKTETDPNTLITEMFKEFVNLYLDPKNYLEDKIENGFLTFKRFLRISPSFSNQNTIPESHDDQIPRNLDNKHIFLSHYYRNIPDISDDQLAFFKKIIKFYIKKQNSSLTHLRGFSFINNNGRLFPIVLTNRPTGGPLISLFHLKNLTDDEGQNTDNKVKLTAEQKFSMIVPIAQGIAFIHNNNFIHSNLNPTTVYLNQKCEPIICDYVFYPQFHVIDSTDEDHLIYSLDSETASKIYENTLNYVAPEILKGEKFDQSSDIYSFGAIMFFILSEEEPKKMQNDCFDFPPNFPEKWKEMIDKCTIKDSSERLKLDEIFNILLDEEKAASMISSIEHKTDTIQISERMKLFLTIVKRNIQSKFNEDIFNIFKYYIPNVNDIDDDTKLVISAAESFHIESIEKVAEWFLTGEHNFYADKTWAFKCYEAASSKNSVFSLIKVAEFYEKGIGTDIDLKESYLNYKKALKMMDQSDPKRSEIERKMNDVEIRRKKLIIKNVQLDNLEISKVKIKSIHQDNQDVVIVFETSKGFDHILKKIENKYQYEIFYSQKVKNDRFDSLEKNLPRLNLEDFYQKKEDYDSVGGGNYAESYKVYKKEETKPYAAKVFSDNLESKKMPSNSVNNFKREIIMSSQFKNHPSIVQYVGFNEYNLADFFNKERLEHIKPTLFMEYVSGGNLEDAIVKKPKSWWNNTKKLIIIIGIAAGLSEIHKNKIIHRDIKPENILLNENGEPVICDLGCARQYSKGSTDFTKNVGTSLYMAPEISNPNLPPIYSCEVDSYSFGVTIYQILTVTQCEKIYPVFNKGYVLKKKLSNYIPPLDSIESDILKNIIRSCWNIAVDERLKPSDIFNILVDEICTKNNSILPDAEISIMKDYIKRLIDAQKK